MSTAANQPKSGFKFFTLAVIVLAIVLGHLIFYFVLGNGKNFVDGDNSKMPLPGNLMGTAFKGGFLVPFLIGAALTMIMVSIERVITIIRANGQGNTDAFVRQIKNFLDKGDITGAIAACDKQRGSVANVVRCGLERYQAMEKESNMDRDQKVLAIQKELEEATTLELPMLEKNLVVLATLASVATLLGLLGTVMGMLRSFASLGEGGGAGDSAALAVGISEALVNTALGIGTSFFAIVLYNVFTTIIDGVTHRIDEAGFSIAQTFASKHSK